MGAFGGSSTGAGSTGAASIKENWLLMKEILTQVIKTLQGASKAICAFDHFNLSF